MESDFESNIDIVIFDMNGKMVEIHRDIDVLENPDLGMGLAQGMYLVAVTQEGMTKTIKVNKMY